MSSRPQGLSCPQSSHLTTAHRDLRHIELLHGLADAELRALEQRCRWQRFAAAQQILDRSSDDRDVFFVVEGSVRAVGCSRSGREVVYAVVAPGDCSAIHSPTATVPS